MVGKIILGISLYCTLVSRCIRAQLQHKLAFFSTTAAYFVSTFIDIIGIWFLCLRFNTIGGWDLHDVALHYGIVHISFACAEGLAAGFDNFIFLLRNGEFQRILLRPRSILLQVAASDLPLHRLGRFIQGLTVLCWAAYTSQIAWTASKVAFVLVCIAGGACLFIGLFIIQAALCFWTYEILEIMNVVTYGGVETAQYPFTIYPKEFKRFFTFVIPLSTIAYYPLTPLITLSDQWSLSLLILSPLAGVLFLLACTIFWKIGVKSYMKSCTG